MRKNLFLYLALACFLGLIAVFVFDGYLGLYDTTYITIGEREEIIEPDYWLNNRATPIGFENDYYITAEWGQKVFFSYEIDNRRFASYSALVEASVWQENEKLLDLFSQEQSIAPFDTAVMGWILKTDELDEANVSLGGYSRYTVKITFGEEERGIVVDLYRTEDLAPPKW